MSKNYVDMLQKAIKFGPHPAYDSFFKDNSYYAYRYAKDVLKEPFLLGELAICEDVEFSYYYAKDVLNGRFKLFEKSIIHSHEYYTRIIIGFNHD